MCVYVCVCVCVWCGNLHTAYLLLMYADDLFNDDEIVPTTMQILESKVLSLLHASPALFPAPPNSTLK